MCKTIQVGNENELCPDLQVHGLKIGKSEEEKYLSDIITCNNSIKTNIESRFSKGIGLIAQIMSLLDEVTFGERYFEVAVLLRQSIFIGGLLFNTEAWYGLDEKEMEELEKIDVILLRKIFKSHSKVAKEALFLELGSKAPTMM